MLSLVAVGALLLTILFAGLPVAFSLGSTSALLIWLQDLPAGIIGHTLFSSLDSFVLLAVPLFILMSQILLEGKVGDGLFDAMNVWVRHLPGGLAIATILSCAFFAAITGSSAATAATVGLVALPALLERGYERRFVYGLIAAGGTLGILIPPSIPMILYGAVTEESVGRLFMAGVVPGLVLTGLFMAYAVWKSRRGGFRPMERASWEERWRVTRQNAWGILLPLLILGGIYTGAFTPTEAAAVGLIYSLAVTLIIYRTLRLRDIPGVCLRSVGTSCMIAMIMAGALLFGKVMTLLEIPQALTHSVVAANLSPLAFILAMNVVMLLLGCVLETVSIILLTMPLVAPLLGLLGIDPIWYAVIVTVNMEMALITPPVGVNLYVISGISKEARMADIINGVLPFLLIMVVMLVIVVAFPQLSLWLPAAMKG